ncbi:tetratricopeptide repeat protein [Sporomusa sp. KB1]|jgi:tetratricopeptide (TPR) repeat protein|uniref:tetratricopeptide repeat-containing glycosyltransferase family protein n=1 Tax=Sporomusa sp. KB1 TaxID=943346 RepID=UPI0011A27CEE|nr:tetratricopeptide repeat-containing glycosyltransferase family protein [Sporomusa sp. KB1]TWH47597.1 glycosyl transferase family 9 (putative heptosyltransferase) [Sporomusa sp. KB1]
MNENQSKAQQQLLLGNVRKEQGMLEAAIQCYQEGLILCPGNAELWFNLASTFLALRRLSEAVEAFQQVLMLRPDIVGAYNNLGGALIELSRLPEAIEVLQQAIALQPNFAEAYSNLGNALLKLHKPLEAAAVLQQAITLKPDFAEAYISLGNALLKLQRPSEAVEVLQQAIAFQPDLFGAYINLGNALQSQGKAEDAIFAYNRAITLKPADPRGYNNRAQAILLSGDLARGFAEYEWRTKVNRYRHFYEGFDSRPRWDGENFAGKRLLVYDEQGFGDTLQFCRYLPLVKARGGIVQFSTKQPLLRLFTNLPGIDELIEQSGAAIAKTQFDLTVPLLSLPHIFGTTLQTIPAGIPYLTVGQHSIAAWRSKMNCSGTNLRVGLSWAGDPANIPGQSRTCGLKAMSPLTGIPGTTFYSLQTGAAAKEANTPPPGMQLIDLTADIADFADTAALIMNLDLVVSVDTAVAHLAGGLGKPVWTLLPSDGEWRWLLARSDTPWYPTMRLFRQSTPGDWNVVMTVVAQELRLLS